MGFLDALLGRTRPVKPNLDVLFTVPAAAYDLQVTLDVRPTGAGAVCFRRAEGGSASRAQADALALLGADPSTRTTISDDEYGYTWVTCQREGSDLPGLVTDLHAVNTTIAEAGYGPSLLCTVIGFAGAGRPRRLGLVYLFKRGTFYPFAPTGGQTRDTALEMQARACLVDELPVESDLGRWFPIWGGPVP